MRTMRKNVVCGFWFADLYVDDYVFASCTAQLTNETAAPADDVEKLDYSDYSATSSHDHRFSRLPSGASGVDR
ncbi:hypothetical protein V5799_024933 [Amblyomma americanum]|uniref:Uncharacterized protein n=1 Tax=Amblyomma americanum TaxID=6943 RepID=A0AAQ4EB13_AMBAM